VQWISEQVLEMSSQPNIRTMPDIANQTQRDHVRNGRNLMFCEDAARRIRHVLDADERIADFWLRAEHGESLHPHDAVAVVAKGIVGGYRASDMV
jgi:hypothetical protein